MAKKILYGVQATGNGHISRAREIVKALKSSGNDVEVVFSGREESKLWDVEGFQPYKVHNGLTYQSKNGKIQVVDTLRKIKALQFIRDIKELPVEGYDVILSDFEPLTAWAARVKKKPVFGLGHQYAFLPQTPIDRGNIAEQSLMKYFAPANRYLGFHWYHFDTPILPPVMPPRDFSPDVVEKKKILVYLLWENKEKITQLLRAFPEYEFYLYMGSESSVDDANIHHRPFSRTTFLDDMLSAAGVISNAGFQLNSEGLHFGKKLLIKPLLGQFEQMSNAELLDKLKVATVVKDFNFGVLGNWLARPQPQALNYPDVASQLAEWITETDMSEPMELVRNTWKETNFNPDLSLL